MTQEKTSQSAEATASDADYIIPDNISINEGTIPFHHPSIPDDTPCQTWYKVVGDLTKGRTPLVVLHGGPGACHNYLLNLSLLPVQHDIPVIFYDQLGNGLSTHLRHKRLDTNFWRPELFLAELDNILQHFGLADKGYDLLGQSWGGMLASMHAVRQPRGLKKLIISNSPSSMQLWVEACREWQKTLPDNVRKAIQKGEEDKAYDDETYKKVCGILVNIVWDDPAFQTTRE
jgi:proline-specific peptidase